MAENKKSFLLYCDIIGTVEKLPKDKAGELFMLILNYVNDKNPTTDDLLLQIAFEPIKMQLKRDLKKYIEILEKRSLAGKVSANKRQQMSTRVESVQHTSTNSTDIDTVTDTVTVIDIKEEIKHTCFSFDEFWNLYDKKLDTKSCKDKYSKISEKDRQKIKDTLPVYLLTIKDKQYQKHPKTYLNNQCWNDDAFDVKQDKSFDIEFSELLNKNLPKEQFNVENKALRLKYGL